MIDRGADIVLETHQDDGIVLGTSDLDDGVVPGTTDQDVDVLLEKNQDGVVLGMTDLDVDTVLGTIDQNVDTVLRMADPDDDTVLGTITQVRSNVEIVGLYDGLVGMQALTTILSHQKAKLKKNLEVMPRTTRRMISLKRNHPRKNRPWREGYMTRKENRGKTMKTPKNAHRKAKMIPKEV